MDRAARTHRSLSIASIALLVQLSACQSSPSASTEQASPVASASPTQVFSNDYAQVCNQVPLAAAASYEQTAGATHPVLVFSREDASSAFSEAYSTLPQGWKLDFPDTQKTELVACLTITQNTLNRVCEFEPDEAGGAAYKLELYDTNYDVALYAANSGEQLDAASFELKADDECPMFHMFTEGELTDSQQASFEQPLLDFIKPYVQPTA